MDTHHGLAQVIMVFFLANLKENFAVNFYCSNNKEISITNVTEGIIYTLNNGSTHYGNNMHCRWTITAEEETSAIQVEVKRSRLQWAPAGAICVGYDYVKVYDGSSSDDREIANWCGESLYSFTSSGSQIHIVFVSNDRNQRPFTGVKLEFKIFERSPSLGSCPPGWEDNGALADGGPSCYSLKRQTVTWTVAQEHCTHDQANLVSIKSPQEDAFIAGLVARSSDVKSYDKVWISLNDIVEDGTYVWIDMTKPTFFSWHSKDHKAESYYNCVVLNKQGKWAEDFCNENDIQSTVKHKFICQKNKVGPNQLFDLPSERTERGGETTPTPQRTWVILGAMLAIIVVVIIVIVLTVCYCRKKKNNSRFGTCRHDSPDAAHPMRRREDARQPPTASNSSSARATAPPPTPPTNQPTTIVMIVPSNAQEPPPAYDDIDHSGSNLNAAV